MKTIQFPFLFAFLLFVNYAYAQTPVGSHYDINGQAINGYFDPLSYAPEKRLIKIMFPNSYEHGCYYDSIGNKKEGLIQFENQKLYFKKENSSDSTIFTPYEVKSFVIGIDSFFVARHFYLNGLLYKKPEYVQYICDYEGNTYAKYYKFSISPFQQSGKSAIKEYYMVKEKGKMILDYFPNGKKFREKALKYFGHLPCIKSQIVARKYKGKDMLSIIKHANYNTKYEKSESIFFDAYWQEIRYEKNAKYHANITNRQDSIWTFDYYQDSVKLYTVNYSSFYPNIKNGEYKAYYRNGIVRHSIQYENNKAKLEKTYDKTGVLKTEYMHYKKRHPTGNRSVVKTFYSSVIDSLGNNIAKLANKQKIAVYDSHQKRTYTHVYRNRELIDSYRLRGKDTVYQITDPSYQFKINPIQKNLERYMLEKDYEKAISANAQGIILISILINKKGNIVNSRLLTRLHPQINRSVQNFFKSNFYMSVLSSASFKPYKRNKSKQFCEFVLPLDFSIVRFYRQPVKFNYMNYFQHSNWHFQQQQMIKNFTPPPPPTFNRKF